jgi:hypothetical protein
MNPRYYPRVVVQGSAVFTVNGFTGEGRVLDLTVPGCLIDSPFAPNEGDSLTLRVTLPQESTPFRVTRGVVRWVRGSCFGVEFIEMNQQERVRYNTTVSTLLHRQTACHARPDQTNYSRQPGGVNWHLEEHGVSTPPLTVSQAGAGRRTR